MKIMKLCKADGSSDEPPTPEVIDYTSPNEGALEDAVERHIAKCREHDEEASIRRHHDTYGSDDDELIAGYGYSHLVTKRPRFSEGHDEASDDDEGEAHLLFSPVAHARQIFLTNVLGGSNFI